MSWLKDWAGQAEGLLNQLDQSAGDALSKAGSSVASPAGVRTGSTAALEKAETQSLSGFTPKREPKSSGYASSVSSLKSRPIRPVSVQKEEPDHDQHLLDFLNEEKPKSQASHSRKSSTSSLRSTPSAFLQNLMGTGAAEEASVEKERSDVSLGSGGGRGARLEREMIELKAREMDLTKAMQAKDSQLAVLRVRLAEADQALASKTTLLSKLKAEKERLVRDSADSSHVRDAALGTLQTRVAEAETELEREKGSARRAETDYRARIQQLETEAGQLAHQVAELSKRHTEEKLKASEGSDSLRLAKYNLEANKKEFDEYKQKAQKILAAKEKLIETLKAGGASGGADGDLEARAELEELRSERDLLKDDQQQAQLTIYNLRTEIQEVESSLAAEQRAGLEAQRELQEAVQSAQITANHYQDQLHHLNKEHQVLQDELRRQQQGVQAKLQEKDSEIQRLMSQTAGRSLLSPTATAGDDAEARVKGLTENLIHKQMTIESLQTEKNNLSLQLERMERLYKEADAAAIRSSHIAIPLEEGSLSSSRLPGFMRETPYDTQVTRGVKRAYGTVDSISVKLGLFLRRYPAARIFLLLYILILHLWVLLVLLTYSPEIHGPGFHPTNPNAPRPPNSAS